MKNKKVLVIVGLILSVVLLFGLTGCDKDPAITQVQNDVATLQANIATINTNIASLQTSVAGIQVPDLTPINNSITTIQSKLTTLESNLTALQNSLNNPNSYATKAELNIITGDLAALANDVSAINTDLEALTEVVDELETRVDNLADDVDGLSDFDLSEIEEAIVDLLERVSNLEDTVEAINIEDYLADIQTLHDNDIILNNKINSLETSLNSYISEPVTITRFEQGSVYATLKTNVAGDYVIIVTLYGSNLSTVSITIPSSYAIDIQSSECYGTGDTMRVLILEPERAGTPLTDQNWTANKTIELDFTNAGNITFISVTTGMR